MTGNEGLAGDGTACGMPVSVQVERLRNELDTRFGGRVGVVVADLYGLEGAQRDTALDAVVEGLPSPFVLVGDRLVCSGAVEIPAVLEALA